MCKMKTIYCHWTVLLAIIVNVCSATELLCLTHDVSVIVGEEVEVGLILGPANETVEIYPSYKPPEASVKITRLGNLTVHARDNPLTLNITIHGVSGGHVTVVWNATDPKIIDEEAYVRVTVIHYQEVLFACIIVGWVYFFAWSISFYPQLYENFQRKSVIGLNLDYVVLNVLGHIVYGLFNIGLYWIPSVQHEYYDLHPMGINPVQTNDVVFSIHAIVVATLTAYQCVIYEKGNQRVSSAAKIFIVVSLVFVFSSCIAAVVEAITWLSLLYYCSYVKLAVTITKYSPQAYMNYTRQSTVGYSIGGVLLDITGGLLSILQMFLVAYNNDDWDSVFGDPTKFGLGLFSVLFDLLFIVQHYILYRGNEPYTPIAEDQSYNDETMPIMA